MGRDVLGFHGGGAGSGLQQAGGTQGWHPKENEVFSIFSGFFLSLFFPPLDELQGDTYLQLLTWQ